MEIGVFGCSFSYGTTEVDNHNNWVMELAKLEPTWNIKNYSTGGTSLSWSLWNFNEYVKKYPNNFTIFQLTLPYRYSYWESYDIDQFLVETNLPNVKHYGPESGLKGIITPNEKIHPYFHRKFKSMYYKYRNIDADLLEFKILSKYIKEKSSFCFKHKRTNNLINDDIACIEDELGTKKFNKFVEDSGGHFGRKGLVYTANFIRDNVKRINVD